MSRKYKHLLSPLRIGNVVLKNRMLSSNAPPHFTQGPENFPSASLIAYHRNLAKHGAAIVTIAEWNSPVQRTFGAQDSIRMPSFDTTNPAVSNYLSKMADEIHFFDSLISISARPAFPDGFIFSDKPSMTMDEILACGIDMNNPVQKNMLTILSGGSGEVLPAERMHEVYDAYVEKLLYYKDCGYDMCSIGIGSYISPLSNYRTDEYGGSEAGLAGLENRARFPLELFKAIKERVGSDFLIEAVLSGEDEEEGGYTVDDVVAFAKMAEGLCDIFQLREKNGALAHPTGYNSQKGEHLTVGYSEAIKKSGAKIVTAPIGGFQDLDENESLIASGKADIIAMGRAFICDPEYGVKAYEGRGEDVVPCIRCNKCHGVMNGPWLDFCSVNPTHGIIDELPDMVDEPKTIKRVAVIGGGPAGMEAAMEAAKRGHKVVLYEKSSSLGGQLLYSDHFSFKWPIRNFRDWLILQLGKLDVTVKLNTEATPEMIENGGFNSVIAAVGAEPSYPSIPGIDTAFTWIEVCERYEELGRKVTIVGGSELGIEMAIHLCERGHDVTILTRQEKIAHDASPLHNITMADERTLKNGVVHFINAWDKFDNLTIVVNATTTKVEGSKVTYEDEKGLEHTIESDSVVVCGGTKGLFDEAMTFADSADDFFVIGDCRQVGDIQRCVREGYSAASRL